MSIFQKPALCRWAVGAVAALALPAAMAADISGAGSTFAYPIYAKWADAYRKQTGNGLNYQSIGSGGGIKQVEAKTVTFGASDKPMSPEDLAKNGLTQFPTIMGGVVVVANLKGIKPGEMVIDGASLADIYLGKITSWDDAALKKLNPNVKLPSQAIAVAHRSDGSGTSFIFTNYLSKVSPEWKDKVGFETAVEWPVGIGGKGNEGVAGTVTQTDGSIGYVEFAYAKQNKLTYLNMLNHDGKSVLPSVESFKSAAASADWQSAAGFNLVLTDQPGADSWPITGATVALFQTAAPNSAAALEALKFFDWAFRNGAKMAEELDYVPMPPKVAEIIRTSWTTQIKDAAGLPVWKK